MNPTPTAEAVATGKTGLVILSAFYEPFMSGAEQMVKEILERLGGSYETTLITARLDRKLPQTETRPTFRLIRVGIGHKRIDKFLYPILAAWRARGLKPKIIHAVMESYAGGALAIAKYFCPDAKRILTLQSGDLDDQLKQDKILIRSFFRLIHRSPDRLTAISSFLAARARRLGVPEQKISITPNGVDFSKIPAEAERQAKRIICVARLSWEKGLDNLIKAWPRVLQAEPQAKLVLVGEGDKRTEIEALIRELDIGASVELLGNQPHDRVLLELKKSEIFVCPSLAEGLGIVFIEAQACGLAVIGTHVGGIPDVIQDKENGLLIEPRSSEAIAEAVIRLLKDGELVRRLASRAQVTSKRFKWQNILTEIDRLYQRLLAD